MNATDILKYGQATVLQAIDAFPKTAWETPGACGVWSVKDIIAHLASYEEVLVDILSGFIGRHSTPYLDKFTEPGGRFNDAEVERRKGRTVREVLDEFNDAHAQVMSLAERIRPEAFRHTGTLPWYGMEYALDDVLVYMYYGHKREHSAQIAAFRDVFSNSNEE
ncbi:MAG TPA: DinB family protein [Ktedonobacteraceae bacterium]|nr:DinB family protein [Ktedonobacteraceae bacterium]